MGERRHTPILIFSSFSEKYDILEVNTIFTFLLLWGVSKEICWMERRPALTKLESQIHCKWWQSPYGTESSLEIKCFGQVVYFLPPKI